jgi:branched-chain amino acid transport system permease protein
VVVALTLPTFASDFTIYLAASTLIVAASATSLNLILGYLGILTMGHAALMGLGAFAAGLSTSELDLPFLAVIVVAGAAAGLIGLGVALISLRWQGIYVVLGTLALQFIALYALHRIQNEVVGPIGFQMPTPDVFGFEINSDTRWYYTSAVLVAATIAVVALLTRSHIGRAWVALRRNPLAAGALGINVTRMTVLGFTIGSVMTGVAGAVSGYFTRTVAADTFTLGLTIEYLSMVLIGGAGTLIGGLLGAVFYTWLPYGVNFFVERLPESWTTLRNHAFAIENAMFGVTIIVVLLVEPGGLMHVGSRLKARASRALGASGARRPDAREPTKRRGGGCYDDHDADGLRRSGWGPTQRVTHWVATLTSSVSRLPISRGTSTSARSDLRSGEGLVLDAVDVVYRGTIHAVRGVRLSVGPGEVVGLVGANGAGKTSTLRAVTGFLRVEHARVGGRVELDGRSLTNLPPYRVARAGVVLVPERDKVFGELTVAQNLSVAPVRSRTFDVDSIRSLFPPLAARWNQRAGFLSGGERQMLALGRALLAGPRVLLVDELSQGLAPRALEEISQALDRILHREELSALIVDQNAELIMQLAQRVYVMEVGRIVRSGGVEDFVDTRQLQAAYLGERAVVQP